MVGHRDGKGWSGERVNDGRDGNERRHHQRRPNRTGSQGRRTHRRWDGPNGHGNSITGGWARCVVGRVLGAASVTTGASVATVGIAVTTAVPAVTTTVTPVLDVTAAGFNRVVRGWKVQQSGKCPLLLMQLTEGVQDDLDVRPYHGVPRVRLFSGLRDRRL